MRSLSLALAVLALGAAPALAQTPDQPPPDAKPAAKPATPSADQLQWGKAPPGLPEGAEVAVLAGDPTKPGEFTIRVRMPDGYRVAPHMHPTAESVEVLSGVLLVAHGENMRVTGPATLEAGGKLELAAGTPHSVTARGITIIEIKSTGPFEIKYLNQADDPRNTGT
ncbi:MAG TPA: cupin domain-containing protein [Gemmatimonadales bacterium]|nr:cupin domain-containing protein [Gemmatimonadales bacterium]